MKLLILTRSSHVGGGTTHTEMLARGLNERGHDCRVAFTRAGTDKTIAHRRMGDIVMDGLCYQYPFQDYPNSLSDNIQAFKPEWVLVDNPEKVDQSFPLSERLRSGATKVAFVAHTEGTPKSMMTRMQPYFSKVICVSQRSAGLLAEFDPVVIRNGVKPPLTTGENVRERLGIPANEFVIGYVGRHDSNKSLSILALAAERANWWCLAAGPQASEEHLALHDAPSANVSIHPGEIDNVGDWYRAMNVFVLPSVAEGFPLSPMEALISGTRVAMTPTSDYPECFSQAIAFFEHGSVGGLIAAVRSAPIPVIGQEIIKREFTLDRMVTDYEEALS